MENTLTVIDSYGSDSRLCDIAHLSYGGSGMLCSFAGDSNRLHSSLIRSAHLSIYEFAGLTYVIQAPIWLARQWMRYRHASYNERSLRHCEPLGFEYKVDMDYEYVKHAYELAREDGAKKQDARKVLPLCSMTRVAVCQNLRSIFHLLEQRLAKQTQDKTRILAHSLEMAVSDYFPISHAAWVEHRKGGRWFSGSEVATIKKAKQEITNDSQ